MGVIDLDARVKKLEEGGASGAILDQLAAEVTALDEQINGNGETDLGLAGDVAELSAGAIPTRTEVTTLTTGDPIAASGGVFYEVLGNLVHIHVAAAIGAGGINTVKPVFTMPEGLRPDTLIAVAGSGDNNLGNAAMTARFILETSDVLSTISNTGNSFGELYYMLNAVTSTT